MKTLILSFCLLTASAFAQPTGWLADGTPLTNSVLKTFPPSGWPGFLLFDATGNPIYSLNGLSITNISYAQLIGLPVIPSTNGLASTNYVAANYYPISLNPAGYITGGAIFLSTTTNVVFGNNTPYTNTSGHLQLLTSQANFASGLLGGAARLEIRVPNVYTNTNSVTALVTLVAGGIQNMSTMLPSGSVATAVDTSTSGSATHLRAQVTTLP